MKKPKTTAQGKRIDIDALRVANETTIAVGNMGVNARGDVLGRGGKIVKTRDQVMKEEYATKAKEVVVPSPDSGIDQEDMK